VEKWLLPREQERGEGGTERSDEGVTEARVQVAGLETYIYT
jgi:hypothetical protein